ncbi:hypothetical protein PI125_g19320 [Phytophthora idaei]|nr:hypothetical protein PI125_g19320 [Phytophthora idaei]KAG3136227.1 hypothetical protein PI126_g17906 [Phytophthora idaei]
MVRDLNRGRQSIRYITTAPGETRTTALGAPLAPTTMSGFIRRTAARVLDLTGYLSPSSTPVSLDPPHLITGCSFAQVDVIQLPDDDSAQRRGATAAPARSDAPPVLAASAHGSSEASPTAPVAPPATSNAFTAQSALPGVSEDALRDIVDEVATAASDRNLAMSAIQLASVTKVLVCAMVQRPRSNDQGFWDQFNRAQTVDEVGLLAVSKFSTLQATLGSSGRAWTRRMQATRRWRSSCSHRLVFVRTPSCSLVKRRLKLKS